MKFFIAATFAIAGIVLSPQARAQTFLEAVEVREVTNTSVTAPDEVEIIDIKAALLSSDNSTFSILLGQCLFPLQEDANDATLKGIAQAAGSGFSEATFSARILAGERVDIMERAPLSCQSDRYRAAVITRVKEFGSDTDTVEIHLVSLEPKTAEIFRQMSKDPDPEIDGFAFRSLPAGYSGETNKRIVLSMRDRSKPDLEATDDEQQESEDIMDALLEYGVRMAVMAIIGG